MRKIKCRECGAILEIEDDKTEAVCTGCGKKLSVPHKSDVNRKAAEDDDERKGIETVVIATNCAAALLFVIGVTLSALAPYALLFFTSASSTVMSLAANVLLGVGILLALTSVICSILFYKKKQCSKGVTVMSALVFCLLLAQGVIKIAIYFAVLAA